MGFRLGDQVVATINGKTIRGEYLDGDSKKSYIITNNNDEIEVRTKKLKLNY
jgi:hypothetical protein